MIKRLLAMLLCVCMAAVLLPAVTFAAGTDAIQLGTGSISGYDSTNGYDYIYFGTYGSAPVKWRVLDDQTNTGAAGLFMLSENCMGTGEDGGVYFDNTDPLSNAWQGSSAQQWCGNFLTSALTPGERDSILATSKSDEAYTSTSSVSFAASNNILNGDKVFFLSAMEAETAAYGFSGANSRIANYNGSAGKWLLRSPFATTTENEGAVGNTGSIFSTYVLYDFFSARPAFNLNLNSVLFTSAAEGGKTSGTVGAGALLPNAPSASPHYYKLTLKDGNRSFDVTETAAAGHSGGDITLHYDNSFATAPADYTNEYISGMIADGSGNVLYYGNLAAVAQQTISEAALTVTLPADLTAGSYTLKLFSEECNGNKNTDYASAFSDVALTVDNTAPTVEISSTLSGATNASAIPVTLTFSENVTGFASGDLSIGNGTAGSFSGSGTTYTAQIAPASEGTVTVDIAAGVAQDAAGNANAAAARFSITSDKTAPAVSGVTNGSSYNTNVKPTFTEDTATLAKDGGTAGAYTPGTDISAEGSYVLKVTDTAGNCTTISFNIDKTAPAVTGVTNGSSYNTNVKPAFTEGTATLAKDGGTSQGYTSGTEISAEGSYVLKVTDAAGNCATISFSINKPAPAVIPVGINCTKTDVTLYRAANGSITITASGGNSGSYEYSIDGGSSWQASNVFSGLSANTYTAAVRDAGNTGNTATCGVAIGQPAFVGSITANKVSSKANAGTAITVIPPAAPKGYTTTGITYSSSNPSVATVDANGNVTFLAGGKVTIITTIVTQITDKNGSIKTKTTTVKKTVTVKQPVAAISLNLGNATLARKGKMKLVPSIAPAAASSKKLKWTSSDKKVATVSSAGVVTGKAGGTAVIICTATDGSGISASCTVTVTPIYPTGVKLSKTVLTLKTGKTASLKAVISPKNTDFKTVTWASSNLSVATVDAKGKVKAISSGTAVVTATTSSGQTVSCTVTVP